MKNLPKFLLFLLIILGNTQCNYDRVELDQCPDDTNPDCPCPNPVNPDCNEAIIFNNLIPIEEITGCSNVGITEVLELKNNAGYMLVGSCDAKSLVLHVDKDATQVICIGTFELNPGVNFFTSIARIDPGNRLVTTGYSYNSSNENTDFFNFLISSSACDLGDEFKLDNITPSPGVNQPWDSGTSIIDDANSDDVIVAGKWEGSPGIIRLAGAENMATSDIEKVLVLDSALFSNMTFNEIQSVSTFPIGGHEVVKIIQLSNGGFLATGFVDVPVTNGYEKRAFVVKTDASLENPILRTYEFDLPYANTWGFDLMEIGNGDAYAMVGIAFNGQQPPALANAQFPVAYPRSTFDGFIQMLNTTDLSPQDSKNWLSSADEDFIRRIVGKDGPGSTEFYVLGLSAGSSSSSDQIRVKSYQKSGSDLEATDFDLVLEKTDENIYPVDIIKMIGKQEYLIVANISTSGNSKGIRLIRIKP